MPLLIDIKPGDRVIINGAVIEDPNAPILVKTGDILQRGKRKFVRLRVP